MSERLASRVWDRADKDCSDYTDAAVNMLEEANATIEQQAKDIEELVELLGRHDMLAVDDESYICSSLQAETEKLLAKRKESGDD